MPNNNDMVEVPLILKFKNDAAGAQKAAKNIEKSFDPLKSKLALISETLEKSPERFVGNLTRIRTAIKSIAPAIDAASSNMRFFYEEIGKQSWSFTQAQSQIKSYEDEIEKLQSKLQIVSDQKSNPPMLGSLEELGNLSDKISPLESQLNTAVQNAANLGIEIMHNRKEVDSLKESIKQGNAELKQLDKNLTTARSTKKIDEYKERQQELTKSIEEQKLRIKELNTANLSLGGSLGLNRSAINRLRSEINELVDEYIRLQQPVEYSTEQLKQFDDEISSIKENLKTLADQKDALSSLDPTDFVGESFLDRISGDPQEFTQYWQAYVDGVQSGELSTEELNERLDNLLQIMGLLPKEEVINTENINNANFAVKRVNSTLNTTKNGFKIMSTALREVRKHISSVVKSATKLASKFTKLFHSTSKSSKELNLNLGKLSKTFIQFGLGARSLYFLVRRLRTEFISAMKEMAAEFPEINAQLSTFTMAVKEYKGSFMTMIQPIASAVIPILTNLLSVLTQLNYRIAEFFATLTGQHVIYKAVADNVDYAKSIDDVAESAKEANKELAEYDNLLVITQETPASSSGSGTGANDNDLGYTFEKVETGISEFAKRLKAAWENADFEGVGKIIAHKFNYIVDTIDDWINNTFEPKGVIWANKLVRVVNGFFSDWDAEATGETISDFFNSIINIINEAVTTFDWGQAGTRVGELITGAINRFDAKQLGITFNNFWNGIFTFLYNTLSEINWASLGNKLGDFIGGVFTNSDTIQKIGKTVRTFFDGILETGVALLQTNPGGKIGSGIATFINSLFDSNKNGQLGIIAGEIINNITSFLYNAFEGTNWSAVGEAMFKNVDTFFATVDMSGVTKSVSMILSSITDIIWGFFDWFLMPDETGKSGLAKTIQFVVDFLVALIEGIPVSKILAAIVSIATKLLASLPTIVIYLVSGLIEIIASVFDSIGVPGIGDAMRSSANDLTSVADEMTQTIVQPISKFVDNLLGLGQEVADDTSTKADEIAQAYVNTKNTISGTIAEVVGQTSSGATDINEAIDIVKGSVKDTVPVITETESQISKTVTTGQNVFQTALKTFETAHNNAIDNYLHNSDRSQSATKKLGKANGDAWKDMASSISKEEWAIGKSMLSMVETAKNSGETIDRETTQTVNDMLKLFESVPIEAEEDAKQILLGLISGMENKMPALANASEMTTWQITNTLRTELGIQAGGPSTVSKDIGLNTAEGLAEGIELKKSMVHDKAAKVSNAAYEGLNEKSKDISDAGKNIADNAYSGLSSRSNDAYKVGQSYSSNFSNGVGSNTADAYNKGADVSRNAYNGVQYYENSFYTSGQNSGYGYGNGIGSGSVLNYVADCARNMANTAINAANATLGVASPSKVFKKIGAFTGEGFALGIESEKDTVLDAVSSLTNNVADMASMADLTNQIDMSFNPVVSELDDVINKLNTVANIFAKIGSNINLPNIVRGSVLPANSSFISSTNNNQNNGGYDISQILDEMLANRTVNNMPEKIQVVLPSGKVLAETVWDEERKLYKQTGQYSPRFA